MKTRKKSKRILSVIACTLLIAAVALQFTGCRNRTRTVYDTAAVKRGDITVTVHGTGAVTPASVQAVTTDTNGKITAVYKNNGDSVAAGDGILDYTETMTGKKVTVTAPEAGIVAQGQYAVGGAVQAGLPLCSVQSSSDYNIVVAVDELDINSVAVGQTASITVDAVPGTTFSGTVQKISQLGNALNGVTTFDVTVGITNPSHIMDNMTASADINTASKKNVLLVPVEALQTSGSDHYVNVLTKNSTKQTETRVKVGVGLTSDSQAEITSGLSEGQNVVLSKMTSTAKGFGLRALSGNGGNGGNGNNNGNNSSSQGGSSADSTASGR